ncbi:MAG: S8 family serine peptidase [Sphingomonas sp.]
MAPVAGQAQTTVRLDEGSAIRLARMRADGAPTVAITAIARPDKQAAALAELRRLGASIRYQDPVGLLAFSVPTAQVAKVLELDVLEAASIDNGKADFLATMETRWLGANADDVKSYGGAPSFDTKAYPALSPLNDMAGAAFRARDPRFDGRGVVIAHVEDFPDFLSPELQVAKDSAGHEVRKFLDVVNLPFSTGIGSVPDWRLAALGPVEQAAAGDLPDGVHRYRRGAIAIPPNVLSLVRLAGHAEELRTGAKAPVPFALLWDEDGRRLWLDADQDGSFRDDRPIGLFNETGAIGILGTDDPATPVRESVGFAVQALAPDRLSLNFGLAPHNTWTAAAMAGSKGAAGKIEGVAPGAQIIAINRGTTTGDYARALLIAYRDPRVDVVLVEGYGGITNIESPDQQRSLLSILVARLQRRSPKLTFVTGGNETAMQSMIAPSTAPGVISISAEQSRAALRDNYGLRAGPEFGLHQVGSAGPAGNGAFTPDVLSPAVYLSAFPRFLPAPSVKGTPIGPPGYKVCEGTSCAGPSAAGAGALLLGAARLQGLASDVPTISRAIRQGARFLPDIQAYEQGYGLIQLEGAWALLASPRAAPRFSVEVEGPVALASAVPGAATSGPGLFEREGWAAGQSGRRSLRLLRTGGPRAPVEVALALQGDIDVFSGPRTVTLPLDVPVTVPFEVHPVSAGPHSAVLTLKDGETPVGSAMLAIVAAEQLTAANGFAIERKLAVPQASHAGLFVAVPAGADALTVSFESPALWMDMQVRTPAGSPGALLLSFPKAMAGQVVGPTTVSIPRPAAGVWEIVLQHRKAFFEYDWATAGQDLPPLVTSVRASVSQVGIEPQPGAAGDNYPIALHNGFAARTGMLVSALAAIRHTDGVVPAGSQDVYDIQVPANAARLGVRVSPQPAGAAGLPFYLYDCASGSCVPSRYSSSLVGSGTVTVDRPEAGRWKLVVDATQRVGAPARYELVDYYVDPALGGVITTAGIAPRKPGEAWSETAHEWRMAAPPAGRTLAPVFFFRDPEILSDHGVARTSSGLAPGVPNEIPMGLRF